MNTWAGVENFSTDFPLLSVRDYLPSSTLRADIITFVGLGRPYRRSTRRSAWNRHSRKVPVQPQHEQGGAGQEGRGGQAVDPQEVEQESS